GHEPRSDHRGMTAEARLALPLAEVGRGDIAIAGGKGANLGELVRAGFPVPRGFVLTTAAYDLFVRENDLTPRVHHAVIAGDREALRAAFESGRIPAAVEEALRTGYRDIGAGAVAVRSSA